MMDSAVIPYVGTAGRRDIGTGEGNVPDLKAGGTLDPAVMPSIALTSVTVVANQDARLALTAQPGDVAIQTDVSKTFILAVDGASVDAHWKEIITPAPVLGSAASHDASDFATAAQGSKADSAVQPGSLGTAATHAATDFATAPGVNTQTLSAGRTLTAGTDKVYQRLDPGAANRNITLAVAGAVEGSKFIVTNTRDYSSDTGQLLIFLDGVSGEIDRSSSGRVKSFIFDGTHWRAADNDSADLFNGSQYGATMGRAAKASGIGVAIGNQASAVASSGSSGVAVGASSHANGDSGTAIGSSASADYFGVAVGASATLSDTLSVAVGNSAAATTRGTSVGSGASGAVAGSTCIGNSAIDNSKQYAFSKGPGAKAYRWAEENRLSELGAFTYKYGYSTIGLIKETTNATPVEIFIGAVANKRIDVLALSGFMFRIDAVAYCNGSTKGKTWRIEGGIRRDGSNNTALIGTVSKTVLSEDGTTNYDISVAADDTNEALGITVTGAASETVRWHCRVEITEVRF